MNQEIVVTGIGMVGPCGNSTNDFFDNLIKGNANIKKSEEMNSSSGVIENLEPEKLFPRRLIRKCAYFSKISLVAMQEALAMAELLELDEAEKERVGFYVGNSTAGWESAQSGLDAIFNKENEKSVSPYLASNWFPAAVQGHASLAFGFKGVSKTIAGDRSSALIALNTAINYLDNGKIDVAIVGGVETPVNSWAMKFYDATKELSHTGEYDVFTEEGTGMMLSEGAAYFILETKEHALKRLGKEKVLAGITGSNVGFYGGEDMEKASELFGQMIQKTHKDPKLVFVSGAGNLVSDRMEAKAYKDIFSKDTIYTCPKTLFGNTVAASGAIDIALGIISIKRGIIPSGKKGKKKYLKLVEEPFQTKVNNFLVVANGYGGSMAAVGIRA